jgi:hypothetical protein
VGIPIELQSSLPVVLRKPQLDDLVSLDAFHVVNSLTAIVLGNPSKFVIWANTPLPCKTQLPKACEGPDLVRLDWVAGC